jgi:hypothetical protein
VILLQGRESFGFIGWWRSFHFSMAVNAKQTATGTVRVKTASPWGIMAGRSRGSQVKQHNFYIHFNLS